MKSKSFKDFIQKITTSGTFGTACKIVIEKKRVNSIDNNILRDDGTMTDNYEEGRRLILDHNFRKYGDEEYQFKNETSQDNIYNSDIDIGEVEKIVSEIKNNKAPGYDEFTGELIKAVFNMNKDLFVDILNTIRKTSKFPDLWKRTVVVLIPKENKDLHYRENYRPVSLLPVWGKVLDKLITNKLMSYLEDNSILNSNKMDSEKIEVQ